jgi:aldose 1-epimerase
VSRTAPIQLQAGDCTAIIDPEQGGRLSSLVIGDRELLVQHGRDVFHWGNFVLAPWVGRLRGGLLRSGGEEYRFPTNAPPHAVHGLVTTAPWQVVGDGQVAVDLADPWSWAGRVVHTMTLAESRMDFRLELHAEEPMPADIGWHPWFNRQLVSPDGDTSAPVELVAEPGRMYGNDEDGLPSGELVAPVPRPWDYCFIDLPTAPSVRWPGLLELEVQSNCSHWVLYDREEAGICVEPWTGPPNSLNMSDPTIVTPDQPLVATMTWTWRSLRLR